ncbi:hypothetical protein GOL94_00170 [Sinorhizobium medicae]|nr:hypothetical protein [Sinorhizobium medicae]
MSLILTPITHGDLCHGSQWEVDDLDILVERVARVAMGQYRHVSQILDGLNVGAPKGSKVHAENAVKKMQVARNGDPWQRDGWLFQIISWIAASQKKAAKAILKPPHIFHAHKGFDGLQLEVSDDGQSVIAIVIFEDKATENPRSTIREDVWPGIVGMEAGERVVELTHEAASLLEAQQHVYPDMDIDGAVDRILWEDARRYRVSITTGSTHKEEKARAGLFADYDTSAVGDLPRRQAETMHFDDLRAWMADFADRVIIRLRELGNV